MKAANGMTCPQFLRPHKPQRYALASILPSQGFQQPPAGPSALPLAGRLLALYEPDEDRMRRLIGRVT